MRLHLQLIAETPDSSLSVLTREGTFLCFVLEDGYRAQKVAGETRIPAGEYRLVQRTHGGFYERHRSRWGHAFVPELLGVPGFSDILIHSGNNVSDTRGCLLVGFGADYKFRTDDPVFEISAGQSTAAYLALYDVLNAEFRKGGSVQITVNRERPPYALKPV